MIEVTGNLWNYPADVRAVTTNGRVKKNGACVMGRGCALEATRIFPGIEHKIGRLILEHGNVVLPLKEGIVTFPVKHSWEQPADPRLIVRSAKQLVAYADRFGWNTVVVPRPGCGNGRLSWDEDVKPLLDPILDDRFHIITF